ncbi:MAG: AAA family ATPase [Oscillospiraceae bacterium]|nr:AAA family ATPase [Oscillospiraceae bacterium]
MSHTIAVAGKGGTGKTTICGILIQYLCRYGKGPVLAVDADANSNLNEVLGIEAPVSLGEIREEITKAQALGTVPMGMGKQEYAEYRFNSALSENDDFDMLVMGRTQGKGCYCYVNGLLSTLIGKFASSYSHIVVDNEAGLEHISRGILPKVDTMLLVSDCSRRGIQAVGRIAEMVKELKLNPGQMKLIVNRAPNGILADGVREEIEKQGLDLLGVVPQDEGVYRCDCEGKPSALLPEDAPAKAAVRELIKNLGLSDLTIQE